MHDLHDQHDPNGPKDPNMKMIHGSRHGRGRSLIQSATVPLLIPLRPERHNKGGTNLIGLHGPSRSDRQQARTSTAMSTNHTSSNTTLITTAVGSNRFLPSDALDSRGTESGESTSARVCEPDLDLERDYQQALRSGQVKQYLIAGRI